LGGAVSGLNGAGISQPKTRLMHRWRQKQNNRQKNARRNNQRQQYDGNEVADLISVFGVIITSKEVHNKLCSAKKEKSKEFIHSLFTENLKLTPNAGPDVWAGWFWFCAAGAAFLPGEKILQESWFIVAAATSQPFVTLDFPLLSLVFPAIFPH
jgi:hypothetical protein